MLMQQQQSAAGINPMNFLIAAAQMHSAGQLSDAQPSAPVPKGKALGVASHRAPRRLKVLK
jgi:hypothetical protein